jgi:metal-dependent amidase/aminoacylase/carboxypeptidase family protein
MNKNKASKMREPLNIENSIAGVIDEIIEIRRYFHQNPELGQNEFNTMNTICSFLDKYGIEYEKNVADTGVVALIIGNTTDKVIGVRADIDALPIKEESNVDFKSQCYACLRT